MILIGLIIGLTSRTSQHSPSVRELGARRAGFGFNAEPRHPAFAYHSSSFQEPTEEIFPIGEYRRRYTVFFRIPEAIAYMETAGSVRRELWYALLSSRSDLPSVSGIGSLGAYLGRCHVSVSRGAFDRKVQSALDSKNMFAVYAIDQIGQKLYYWVIGLDGAIHGVHELQPFKDGDPYPVATEELDVLKGRK